MSQNTTQRGGHTNVGICLRDDATEERKISYLDSNVHYNLTSSKWCSQKDQSQRSPSVSLLKMIFAFHYSRLC